MSNRFVFESEEPITFHDDEGNIIAETKGGFLMPLLASAAGPIISALLESLTGKKPDSVQRCDGSGHRIRRTKGRGMEQELMAYLVPYTNQGNVRGRGRKVGRGRRRGGDISLGAEEMNIPEGALENMMGALNMNPVGGVRRSPFSYDEITYPKGGRVKRGKGRKARGGFAVDQQQSNNYSGFALGQRAMFPINRAGLR